MIGDLAAAVIENQKGSDMDYLAFDNLCLKNPGDEPSMEEMRLIDALLNSPVKKLSTLFLDGNTKWFS